MLKYPKLENMNYPPKIENINNPLDWLIVKNPITHATNIE